MTGSSAETGATFDELDALPTEELRQRAFAVAREHLDLRFFWSIFEHLPHADDAADGAVSDLSSIGPTVDDAVALWREFTGHSYGETEPLLRAAFIDYLLKRG